MFYAFIKEIHIILNFTTSVSLRDCWSCGIFKYLPFSITTFCALILNLQKKKNLFCVCSCTDEIRFDCKIYDVGMKSEGISSPRTLTKIVPQSVVMVGWLVSWCFEPSQPQRITSGLGVVIGKRHAQEILQKKPCLYGFI